jgi:chromosome segregation ATPase
MAVQNITPPTEVDPEATAELPAIDFAGTAADIAGTDVHIAPGIPAGVAELASSLREAEQRLARKMERVAGLETDLVNALRTAVELRAQLDLETAASVRHEKALREAEQQLTQKSQLVTGLETTLAEAQRAAVELQAKLDQDRSGAGDRENAARELVTGLEQKLSGLRKQLAASQVSQQHQAGDLSEQRRRNERLQEVLQTWHGFRGVVDAQLAAAMAGSAQSQAEAEARSAKLVSEAEARSAKLVSEAQARSAKLVSEAQARSAQLQSELGAASEAARDRAAALEESLRVAQSAREEATAALQAQQAQNQELKVLLDSASARAGRVEQDLHVAEEHIQRLESDAHASATLLGNLQQNVERLARDDSGSRPTLRVVATEPQRVLVRQVDGVEVVYPLGRRTTIGRTPDNDIQVDTTFISRHHAVLLSNPDQCVVEDLNSTNGVKINGRPVNRQALRDGDTLTIGKSEFRYQQRA